MDNKNDEYPQIINFIPIFEYCTTKTRLKLAKINEELYWANKKALDYNRYHFKSPRLWNHNVILPNNITTMVLWNYNKHIGINILPRNLRELVMNNYTKNIGPMLHGLTKLHTLKLLHYNRQLDKDMIPDNVENLKLRSYRRQLHKSYLPAELKTLYLRKFDNIIDEEPIFPDKLEILTMVDFNRGIGNPFGIQVFPFSLRELHLIRFSKTILPNVLPSNLQTLEMVAYNRPFLQDSLPDGLEHLYLHNYNLLSTIKLPTNLRKLRFGWLKPGNINTNIRFLDKLEHLELNNYRWSYHHLPILPPQLKTLKVNTVVDQHIVFKYIPVNCKVYEGMNTINVNTSSVRSRLKKLWFKEERRMYG
jgi:hypothetical protein